MKNIKLHVHGTIFTPGAQFLGANIKDFYYDKPMERFEYAEMKLDILPDEIIAQYNLKIIEKNGWVYI